MPKKARVKRRQHRWDDMPNPLRFEAPLSTARGGPDLEVVISSVYLRSSGPASRPSRLLIHFYGELRDFLGKKWPVALFHPSQRWPSDADHSEYDSGDIGVDAPLMLVLFPHR